MAHLLEGILRLHSDYLALQRRDTFADGLLGVRGRLGHHHIAGFQRVCLFRPELHEHHVPVRVEGWEHGGTHADRDIEDVLVEAVQQAAELLTPARQQASSQRVRARSRLHVSITPGSS